MSSGLRNGFNSELRVILDLFGFCTAPERVLADPGAARNLAQRARARVEREFGLEQMCDRYADILESVTR